MSEQVSILDNLPPNHHKLCDYGERPYWSLDGKKIFFIEKNYGDVCEMDFETRQVRNLTKGLGEHHSFLRVLFLSNGDLLLIGPKEFKDRHTSRQVESELWVLDKDARRPPVPLGRAFFEGVGVSITAPRLTYALNGRHDPNLGSPDTFECYVTDIAYDDSGKPYIARDKVFYHTEGRLRPEPQDFVSNDNEVLLAEYVRRKDPGDPRCIVKIADVATGKVRTIINEPGVHNECEGIFPNRKFSCLESSRDAKDPSDLPYDLWKLALDGSGMVCRLTHFYDRYPWRVTNSNVSPDGRWLAFMVNRQDDEAGYGRGLGLLDLKAWEESPEGKMWEKAATTELAPDGKLF